MPALSGFANHFGSEAIPESLPLGRNAPQRCPRGLYAEQFSATPFSTPRARNRRSWLYRIRPTAATPPSQPIALPGLDSPLQPPSPDPLRWDPPPDPPRGLDWVDALQAWAGCGDPLMRSGLRILLYAANRDMTFRHYCDADGELLLLPQQGRLRLCTEFGVLSVEAQQLALIPRGVRFRVELPDGDARGYACTHFGAPLQLPELGPIGANGLAAARDFVYPDAHFEDSAGDYELVTRYGGRSWSSRLSHSPLDVVAWHGNCAPCVYDLRRFNSLGSISFDHPDPSIFSVLQSPSALVGEADWELLAFAPRVLAMRDTFRPPWYHRNVASEFMGLVHGRYEARSSGFEPGGCTLHASYAGHGPDAQTEARARTADLSQPQWITDTMAFMLETRLPLQPTLLALQSPTRQADYWRCWQDLPRRFEPESDDGR